MFILKKLYLVLLPVISLLCTACVYNMSPTSPIGIAYIFDVARRGDVESLMKLMYDKTVIRSQDQNGQTPLHIAASNGDLDVVNILIRISAKLDQQDHNGRTPLHNAALHNHPTIYNALFLAGANAFIKDKNGRTPVQEHIDLLSRSTK